MPGTLAAKTGKAIKMYKKQKDTYIFDAEYSQSFFGDCYFTYHEWASQWTKFKEIGSACIQEKDKRSNTRWHQSHT